jgi:holliday junction DNA helicase RuvA
VISRVRGTLLRRELAQVEVMTPGGVAYELAIPLSVFERLPKEGSEIELRAVHVVREDAVTLYGFLDESERAVFRRLLDAAGVGPRLALSMLSALSPERLVRAIADKDIAVLRQVPGVGTKKAERIVLELADKLDDLMLAADRGQPRDAGTEDAVGALVALGYTTAEASLAVRHALDRSGGGLEGVELIRAALAGAAAGK